MNVCRGVIVAAATSSLAILIGIVVPVFASDVPLSEVELRFVAVVGALAALGGLGTNAVAPHLRRAHFMALSAGTGLVAFAAFRIWSGNLAFALDDLALLHAVAVTSPAAAAFWLHPWLAGRIEPARTARITAWVALAFAALFWCVQLGKPTDTYVAVPTVTDTVHDAGFASSKGISHSEFAYEELAAHRAAAMGGIDVRTDVSPLKVEPNIFRLLTGCAVPLPGLFLSESPRSPVEVTVSIIRDRVVRVRTDPPSFEVSTCVRQILGGATLDSKRELRELRFTVP